MEIEFFREHQNAGTLKATFQAVFAIPPWGELGVNISYYQKEDGSTWFGYPSREYIDKEGKKKFFRMVFFKDKAKDHFENDLKKTLQQYPQIASYLNLSPSVKKEPPDFDEPLPF